MIKAVLPADEKQRGCRLVCTRVCRYLQSGPRNILVYRKSQLMIPQKIRSFLSATPFPNRRRSDVFERVSGSIVRDGVAEARHCRQNSTNPFGAIVYMTPTADESRSVSCQWQQDYWIILQSRRWQSRRDVFPALFSISGVVFPGARPPARWILCDRNGRCRSRIEIEKEETMRSEDVERDDRSRIQEMLKTIPRKFLSLR